MHCEYLIQDIRKVLPGTTVQFFVFTYLDQDAGKDETNNEENKAKNDSWTRGKLVTNQTVENEEGDAWEHARHCKVASPLKLQIIWAE